MGKASRRVRDKTGPTQPRRPTRQASAQMASMLLRDPGSQLASATGGDKDAGHDAAAHPVFGASATADKGDLLPPEHPGWQSHHEGFVFFKDLGWEHVRLVPKYTAPEFRAALEARLRRPHMQLVDRTSVVPLGPNASHRELPAVLSDLMLECEAYPHRIILLLRNGFNTPAFLGGLWTWFVHEHRGAQRARRFLEPQGNPTPGLIAVNAQGFNVIPTHVLVCELPIAVGMASMLLNENPYEFLCCVCSKPFVAPATEGAQIGGTQHRGLLTALGGRCGHAYHVRCLRDHLERAGNACHGCAAPLPPDLVPERCAADLDEVCRARLDALALL